VGMATGEKEREEKRPPSAPYTALDAFLLEHGLCRPGLDEPHVTETVVALACECGARITVRLPPLPARGVRDP
jgi:hypothetical protein